MQFQCYRRLRRCDTPQLSSDGEYGFADREQDNDLLIQTAATSDRIVHYCPAICISLTRTGPVQSRPHSAVLSLTAAK